MDKTKLMWLAAGVVIGVVAAPKLRSLPLVSKLPTA